MRPARAKSAASFSPSVRVIAGASSGRSGFEPANLPAVALDSRVTALVLVPPVSPGRAVESLIAYFRPLRRPYASKVL